MSKIEIKINHTKSVNKQIKQLSSNLTVSRVSLSMIRNHIDSQVAHRRSIGPRLNEVVTRINASEKRLQDLYQCIDHSLDLYVKAEKRVQSLKLDEVEKKSVWDTVKDSIKGFGKGLGTAVVSTVEGIWHAFTHPVETIKGTIHVVTHPVETGKAIWKAISDSWKKDVVNGDAESRSEWFGRGFGEVALAIVGTKGVDKGVKLLRGSEILQNEIGAVRIGRESSDKIEGKGNDNSVNVVKEIDFGKHIIKGENGKKQLIPNTMYITNDNYKYTTDGLRRIVNVEAAELIMKKAERNKYAQANVGGIDRLPDDDGGHLIGAQFNGPSDIDNLVPQNSQINRKGGVWYEMETEWANALKEIPPKKVSVNIEPIYSNNSIRPDSFLIEYEIEGEFPVIREIANRSGG